MPDRRSFIKTTSLAAASVMAYPLSKTDHGKSESKVACQQYTCFTYFKRENKDWFADLNVSMQAFAASGLKGYEPAFSSVEEAKTLQPVLKKHSIWSASLYVNSTLHEAEQAQQSIDDVLQIARITKPLGTRIVVTNPSPIQWGGPENKSDAQLQIQAQALNQLGSKLRDMDMVLAYHNHDIEMRESAREFHHMMLGTDPKNVSLCLDAHWIYRGAGNSEVALFDIVNLYADRIVELHLRQSHEHIWSEVFAPGDIDYLKLAEELKSRNLTPHLVLEQAVETGTPHTMGTIEALRQSLAYVHEVFG